MQHRIGDILGRQVFLRRSPRRSPVRAVGSRSWRLAPPRRPIRHRRPRCRCPVPAPRAPPRRRLLGQRVTACSGGDSRTDDGRFTAGQAGSRHGRSRAPRGAPLQFSVHVVVAAARWFNSPTRGEDSRTPRTKPSRAEVASTAFAGVRLEDHAAPLDVGGSATGELSA